MAQRQPSGKCGFCKYGSFCSFLAITFWFSIIWGRQWGEAEEALTTCGCRVMCDMELYVSLACKLWSTEAKECFSMRSALQWVISTRAFLVLMRSSIQKEPDKVQPWREKVWGTWTKPLSCNCKEGGCYSNLFNWHFCAPCWHFRTRMTYHMTGHTSRGITPQC